jgi:hypothetical protein
VPARRLTNRQSETLSLWNRCPSVAGAGQTFAAMVPPRFKKKK